MPAHLRLLELRSGDFARTASFYARVCDWEVAVRPDGSAAGQTDGDIELRWIKPERVEAQGALAVLEVDDLDARLAAVEAAGGRVLVPQTPIAGGGNAALIADPDGNVLALQTRAPGAGPRAAATAAATAAPAPRRSPPPKKARPTGAGKPRPRGSSTRTGPKPKGKGR